MNKNDTTWSATQVGLRPVKAGLGGHDDGVWGSTRGSRTHRFCSENGDERQGRMRPPSVVLREQAMKVAWSIETARINAIDNHMPFPIPHRFTTFRAEQ